MVASKITSTAPLPCVPPMMPTPVVAFGTGWQVEHANPDSREGDAPMCAACAPEREASWHVVHESTPPPSLWHVLQSGAPGALEVTLAGRVGLPS
jgi:hypothetical protein